MKRVVLTLFWVFAATLVCSAQTTLYYAQIANGDQGGGISWKTTIFITNPNASGSSAISGSVTFFSDGTAFNLSFVDSAGSPVGSGNTLPFQVAGGQTRKFVSTGTGSLRSGFGVVSATGNVTGTAVFSQFNGTTLVGEAGVPGVSAVARQAIYVDEQSGFATAVAYANPGTVLANVTLSLLNTEGVTVASTAQTLGANVHRPVFVNGLFSNAGGVAGTMQITSNQPLAAIALRFSASGLFTTLPPVTLASLINPAVQWFAKALPSPLATFARLLGQLEFRIG